MKRKKSIKRRILLSVLMLIIVTLLGIIAAFNILVAAYIKKSATAQIKQAAYIIRQMPQSGAEEKTGSGRNMWEKHGLKNENYFNILREAKQKARRTQEHLDIETMIVSGSYDMIIPNMEENFLGELDDYEMLLQEMKAHQIDLDSHEVLRLNNGKESYYLGSLKLEGAEDYGNCYIILFIDVSSTLYLARQINIMLGILMGMAMLLAVLIAIVLSKRIARPIEALCEAAKKLGEGDFSGCDFEFEDAEIDTLCKIMNQSARCLEQYDKEQKIFFQNVSHELRTPLMSIKGYAEAIKYGVIGEQEASGIILEESDRLGELIEELLYISRMDNITKDYKIAECDLREVLSNCTLRQKAKAINEGIAFSYDFDMEPVLYNCDEKNISRAFSNLIANALRYAHKEIIIGCRGEENRIVIYIEDDGEGIKEKDLPYIFERFYKGEKGKHGIGLSIVKSVIMQHQGEVYAQNTGRGARFTILLKK